jgi:outer membrane protein assembly factor BamD (BamD/ComL family)
VPPELQYAHRLLDEGEYAEAANTFHELARKAEDRFPERAPFLYIEAGQAAMLNHDGKKAVTYFRSGLTLLGSQQRHHRLRKAGRRIVAELRDHGFHAEADEVESVVSANATVWGKAEASAPKQRPILPTHCPSCGAAVRSDEVEWLDGVTAECDYCGSPVRAGS